MAYKHWHNHMYSRSKYSHINHLRFFVGDELIFTSKGKYYLIPGVDNDMREHTESHRIGRDFSTAFILRIAHPTSILQISAHIRIGSFLVVVEFT